MSTFQPHIKLKSGDIAPYVLIPGDPARVKKIANYWDEAREVVFNREFLTMTGRYKSIPVSAISTGIGCPSAAIAVEELSQVGAKVLIRIGTCGALQSQIKGGDLIIPNQTLRQDGTTQEYVDQSVKALPNKEVYQALVSSAEKLGYRYFTGINRTHDAFYEPVENFLSLRNLAEYKSGQLISSEMECSAVFLVGKLKGLQTGAILAVNTEEPLDLIAENPEMIYHLETSPHAVAGVDKAIQTALTAIEDLAKNNK